MEENKNNDKQGQSGASGERVFPTALHRLMDMTHGELLDDFARRGETAQGALAAFDRIVDKLRPKLPTGAVPCRPTIDVFGGAPRVELGDIPFYEAHASAGSGSRVDEGSEFRPATLSDLFGRQNWPALVAARVSGWSMRDARIADGDAVLVDTRRQPRDGDIVLAYLQGSGQVVKRLRLPRSGGALLQSANPDFEPIRVDDMSSLAIQGVVVGRAGGV